MGKLHVTEEEQVSEGALFKEQLGETWMVVPSNVRERFDHDPVPGSIVSYEGVMTRVTCTPLGKALGWLMQRTGALMPHEGKDVPVQIEVWTDARTQAVYKRRTYLFANRAPFVFRSRMERQADGRLAEHVGGGFGMYVLVSADRGGLRFDEGGYFFELCGIRVPIPRVLGPGKVVLMHADVSASEFEITIDIAHPWFGPLFSQVGRFRHANSDA
jgi:hypothetical protein